MRSGCTVTPVSKTIQIRDVPDDVHAELRSRAAAAGVSLSDYLLREATRIASRPPIADVLEWVGDRGWGVPAGNAVATLRELRDESSIA
jgi:antitoxin FitA